MRKPAFRKEVLFIFLIITLVGYVYLSMTANDSKNFKKFQNGPHWWIVPNEHCATYFQSNQSQLPLERMRQLDQIAEAQTKFNVSDVYRGETESCHTYLTRRHFITESLSEEEKNFPLAYSVLTFKDYPQVEMLLRTIYRPEHTICIHVDQRVNGTFLLAVKRLVECFPDKSIFLLENPVWIIYGSISILDADLRCMKRLWELHALRKWKYFMNLAAQEFPLRTNLELVKILQIFNGANNMEGTVKRRDLDRLPNTPLPFPLLWVKGNLHITVTAAFVNFTLHSVESQIILKALRDTQVPSPDETLLPTLYHNPHLKAPGAYLLEPESHPTTYPYITRLVNWLSWPYDYACTSGRVVRGVCIWGLGDIAFISQRPELFTNKFHWSYHNLALQCMQEQYWNRTMADTLTNTVQLNLTYYENLSFVKYHL